MPKIARQTLRRVSSKGFRFTLTTSEPARYQAVLRLGRTVLAKTDGLLGRPFRAQGLRLRMDARAKRSIAGLRRAALVLTVTASDASGNRRVEKSRLTLKR